MFNELPTDNEVSITEANDQLHIHKDIRQVIKLTILITQNEFSLYLEG